MRVGSRMIDASLATLTERLENRLREDDLNGRSCRRNFRILRSRSPTSAAEAEVAEVGRVLSVGDGIARVYGLDRRQAGDGRRSRAAPAAWRSTSKSTTSASCIFGDDRGLKEGDTVRRARRDRRRAGRARACSAAWSTRSATRSTARARSTPPNAAGRREGAGHHPRHSVHGPMSTGLKAIDALIPIGRGQRELIIGDRQTGKTAVVLDAILYQKRRARQKRPESEEALLHLRRRRPKALDGGAAREDARRQGRAFVLDHRRRHRFGRRADCSISRRWPAARWAKFFPRQRHARAHHL